MDNAGGYAADLSCEGVQIEFLPPNTMSFIQLMNQGVICAFKAIYICNTFNHLSSCVEQENFSIKEYWHNYNIHSALQNERAITCNH